MFKIEITAATPSELCEQLEMHILMLRPGTRFERDTKKKPEIVTEDLGNGVTATSGNKGKTKKEFVEDETFVKPAEKQTSNLPETVWNEEEQAELEAAEAQATEALAELAVKPMTRDELRKIYAAYCATNPGGINTVKGWLQEMFNTDNAVTLNDNQRGQLAVRIQQAMKG